MIEFLFDSPFYVRRETKDQFNAAVGRDTRFLARMNIMDYSLIMGLDGKGNIYIGIVDILRTWTWDKKLEMIVKKSGILGNSKEVKSTSGKAVEDHRVPCFFFFSKIGFTFACRPCPSPILLIVV